MRLRKLAVPICLVPLAWSGGCATVSAPKADQATSTTMPPTTAANLADPDPQPGTTTTMPEPVEQSGDVVQPSAPPSTVSASSTIPPGSIANGPLPVNVGDVWWRLALCEDGGRNRWFPPYSGYFHFLPSTYQAYGGVGFPHEHDYETQLAVAQRLQSIEGWWPWPGCARKLGLL